MDNRTFGYARVSSKEQHEDRQIEALTKYGVSKDNIIVDKCSGKDTERCKLARKIQKMKKGGKRWVKEKKPRKVTVYRDILSEQK